MHKLSHLSWFKYHGEASEAQSQTAKTTINYDNIME